MRNGIAAMMCGIVTSVSGAATITVVNDGDSGPGTLRQAVLDAASGDTINFAPSAYGTITLTSGAIRIQKALAIVGPGAANLAIDGNGTGRIFTTFSDGWSCPTIDPPANVKISISGLTLQHGLAAANRNGGAIVAGTDLSLDSVVIKNNVARNGGGVGFFVQYAGQTLAINNAQFVGNVATPTDLTVANPGNDNGGALFLNENCSGTATVASATITNSVFDGNSTQPVTLGGFGGAIATFLPAGSISIQDTRIVRNQALYPPTAVNGSSGGGVYGYAATLRIERTEIASNSAKGEGGFAVFNPSSNPAPVNFSLINSTVSGNQAQFHGAGQVRSNVNAVIANSTIANNSAGGFVVAAFPNEAIPTVDFESSIFAGSTGGPDVNTGGPAMPNPYTQCTARHALAANPAGNFECPVDIANIDGIDPMLMPLAFNGGSTRTHALSPGSVAIAGGANPLNLTTDQRGAGFPRTTNGATDIGALQTASFYALGYVQKAYVAYYGRPADPPGQSYWATRMDSAGGSLDAIIAAFGTSDEFSRRYGGLTNTQLVTKIYQQALNRDPDPAGLAWYVEELNAGRRTLQTITLDVLNGATTAPDSMVVANKLDVAAYYTAKVAAGCSYGAEQDGVNALAGVTNMSATVAAAKAAIDSRCGL